MAEEFQESEVIFNHPLSDHRPKIPSYLAQQGYNADEYGDGDCKVGNRKKSRSEPPLSLSCSAPVNIPESVLCFKRWRDCVIEEEYEKGEIVPPHVITERRLQGKIASSVCTGNGRTLKGRDLSRVRNSILRMTGFLEA